MSSSASLPFFLFLLLSLPPMICSSSSDDRGGDVRGRQDRTHFLKPRLWPWPYAVDDGRYRSWRRIGGSTGRMRSGALSAMLPRGFVPPSDSSRCQNNSPESAEVFCVRKPKLPAQH
ncbi:hypothetical protein ZIOFF_047365 [Zingiber officinale]|uniref:Secreted protein n=1 Tax=Zingiber officinale TaxID=94328 RepID=A0A8J5FXQ8_ZINOF|nr:hypothetical protein ZIOFF_047365 [Zingiber officinale]